MAVIAAAIETSQNHKPIGKRDERSCEMEGPWPGKNPQERICYLGSQYGSLAAGSAPHLNLVPCGWENWRQRCLQPRRIHCAFAMVLRRRWPVDRIQFPNE